MMQGQQVILGLQFLLQRAHFEKGFYRLYFFDPLYFFHTLRVFACFLLLFFQVLPLFPRVYLLLYPQAILEKNQVLCLQHFQDLSKVLILPLFHFRHYSLVFSIFFLRVFLFNCFLYRGEVFFLLDFGLQIQDFKMSLYRLYFIYLFDVFPSTPFFFVQLSSFSPHINVSILQFSQVSRKRFILSKNFPHVFNLNLLEDFIEDFLPPTGPPFFLFFHHFLNDFIFDFFYLCLCLCHVFPSFPYHFEKIFRQYQQNFPKYQEEGSIRSLRKVLQTIYQSVQIGYQYLLLNLFNQWIHLPPLSLQQGQHILYLPEYKKIYFLGILRSFAYWLSYNRGLFIRNRLRKYHERHEGCCQQFFHQQQNENDYRSFNRPQIQIRAIQLNCLFSRKAQIIILMHPLK